MIIEELLSRASVEDLIDIVAERRRRFIRHILRLPISRPAIRAMNWIPEGGRRRLGRPKRTWRDILGKICKQWVSVAVTSKRPEVFLVIVRDGDNSSPSVPAGT